VDHRIRLESLPAERDKVSLLPNFELASIVVVAVCEGKFPDAPTNTMSASIPYSFADSPARASRAHVETKTSADGATLYCKFVSRRQEWECKDKRRPSRHSRMHMSVRADSTIYHAMVPIGDPLVIEIARGLG
jgi:hypothetical protein